MSRKIALPLLVAAALVSIILASRTPQLIIEELPPEEADAHDAAAYHGYSRRVVYR